MVAAVFQGIYDIPIKTFITGYVPRVAGWKFNYGSIYPCSSGTRLLNTGTFNGICGGWCDVFSASQPGSGGRFSLNQWGDLSPATATGNFNPSYSPVDGQIHGIHFSTRNGAPFDCTISGYKYPASLTANSNYPSANLAMPSQINPGLITVANAPVIPTFQNAGSIAFLTSTPVVAMAGFYVPAAPVDMFDDNGFIYHILGNSARGIAGIVPSQNIALYNNGAIDCLVNLLPTVGAPIIVTWDNATINTALQDAGAAGTGLTRSTISPWGFLSFFLGTLTIAGRTLTNFVVLTSFDGLKYWLINMIPMDAAAIVSLSGAGSARTAHISPDGTFMFQNSLQASIEDKVFSGFFPASNILYVGGTPYDLPTVPYLNPPYY